MKKNEIKNLDKIWSEQVKIIAKDFCEVCGLSRETSRLNSCHIIGRAYRATRWGAWLVNSKGKMYYDLCGFCGCFRDHMEYDSHGPKEELIRTKTIGVDRYNRIRAYADEHTINDLEFEEVKSWIISVKNRNDYK